MKKILFTLSLAASAIVFNSCEELDDDFYRVIAIDSRCEEFSFEPTPANPKRNILIEDFTGHLCPNCPTAAETAKDLEEANNGQVIVMAIHPGGSGFTSTTALAGFTYDFSTEGGTEIDDVFGASGDGLPIGMINRRTFNGDLLLGNSKWVGAVEALKPLPAMSYLEVQARFQEDDDSIICIDTKIDLLADYDADLIMFTSVVEDSIVKFQKNGAATIEDYIHMHVLRDTPLGAFGIPVGSAPYTANDEFIQRVSLVKGNDWVPKNLKVISYIYDKNTNEILQVAENHVEIE